MRRRALVVVCLVIAVASSALAAPKRARTPNRWLGEILVGLMQNGDLARARTALAALTKAHPRYAPALFDLGVVAEAQRDWAGAEAAFARVAASKRDAALAARARRELDKVRQLREREAAGQGEAARYDETVGRGRAYLSAGFSREAGVTAVSAIGIDRTRWEAFALLGSVRSELKDPSGAAEALRAAAERAPAGVAQKLSRAASLAAREAQYQLLLQSAGQELRSRKYVAAANHFLAASELFPEREHTVYSAATAYLAGKRSADARELLRTLESSKDAEIAGKATRMLQQIEQAFARPRVP